MRRYDWSKSIYAVITILAVIGLIVGAVAMRKVMGL